MCYLVVVATWKVLVVVVLLPVCLLLLAAACVLPPSADDSSSATHAVRRLRWLKEHCFSASATQLPEPKAQALLEELRLSLVAPSYAGPLMLLSELTVPSLLGVRCEGC
eukprot:SAG11_NODE_14521_length_609_cov_0.888235_1_plen_108_part_01